MNLFVYGTLLFPEIRETIGGRAFRVSPAKVEGFRIARVLHATFPGIVRDTAEGDNFLTGEVLFNLSEEELERFDRYEDGFYIRSTVSAILDGGPETECVLYEVPPQISDQILSDEPWTKEWFQEHHYEEFVRGWIKNA